MNKHDVRTWESEYPEAVHKAPFTSQNVIVWYAMHKTKMIGPYFFRQASVESAAYKSMLRYYGLNHTENYRNFRFFSRMVLLHALPAQDEIIS